MFVFPFGRWDGGTHVWGVVTRGQKADFKATSAPVSLRLDHPEYAHSTVLTTASLAALRSDLSVA